MINLLPTFLTIIGLNFNPLSSVHNINTEFITSQGDPVCRAYSDGSNIPSSINPTINVVREQIITCFLQRDSNKFTLEAWFTRTPGTFPLFGLEVQRILNDHPFYGVSFIIELKMIRGIEEYAQTILRPQIGNEDFFVEVKPYHQETIDRLQQSGYVRGPGGSYILTINQRQD